MASSLVLGALPAIAQDSSGAAQEQIGIDGGAMGDALVELGERFGVNIIAPDRLIQGKTANAVTGLLTAEEALEMLLEGSSLQANARSNNTFLIAEAEPVTDVSEEARIPPVEAEPEDQPRVEDTIVVTGTKQNLSLQETTTSVAVFTQEAIREQVIQNFEDVLLRTPNVANGAVTLNNLSIRGISLLGVGGIGNTSNIYVDGAPNSGVSNQGAANLWDVTQVEILRGPQSTTQGRNALAGAVVIQTADPEYEFGAEGRVLIGNEDQRTYSGVVTGPIIEDQLAFRLVADYREADFGVTDAVFDEPNRFEEALTLRGKLLFEPNAIDDLRVEVIGGYTNTEFGGLNGATAATNAVAVTTDPAAGTFDISFIDGFFDTFDPLGDVTFPPAGLLLRQDNEVYRAIADVRYELNDHWDFVVLGTFEDAEDVRDLGIGGAQTGLSQTYSAEARAQFDYGRLRGWVGGYYFNLEEENETTATASALAFGLPTLPADSVLDIVIADGRDTENFAVFGDVTYELNEKWTFNFGARFDIEEFDDTGAVTTVDSTPADCIINPVVLPGLGGQPCAVLFEAEGDPSSADFDAFLPRGSVTYNFDADRALSFVVQRGYRAGGSFLRGLTGEPLTVEQFDPEFITNYELAFRSLWFDDRLRVNANAFYADWTDQQITIFGQSGLFDIDILNAGESELYGLEIETEFVVNTDLAVFASLGLLQTEFIDFPLAVQEDETGAVVPINPDIPDFANLAGNEFNNAPPVTASIGFAYDHPSGLFASGNAAYTRSAFQDVFNFDIEKSDDLVLANARVGYRFRGAELSLFANNLFDERSVQPSVVNLNTATGLPAPSVAASFFSNEPRLWGVEMRLRY